MRHARFVAPRTGGAILDGGRGPVGLVGVVGVLDLLVHRGRGLRGGGEGGPAVFSERGAGGQRQGDVVIVGVDGVVPLAEVLRRGTLMRHALCAG